MRNFLTMLMTFFMLSLYSLAFAQDQNVEDVSQSEEDTTLNESTDSASEESTIQIIEEEEIEESGEEPFTENDCECAICKCMNTIYTRWEKFIPSSPLEQIIKTNIDKIQL